MKTLLKLFMVGFLTYSCELPEINNNPVGGDCNTTDYYIYEDQGFAVITGIYSDPAQIGKQLNKLDWYYEYPDLTEGEIYYYDSIISCPNNLKLCDTLKLQKKEFGHMEGSCGPQMDSVVFTYIE